MKKIIWIIIIILTGNKIYGQFDSIFNTYNREFEEYYKLSDKEFNSYKALNDSAFLKFLQETWQEFEVFRYTHPVRPKPKEQPVIKEKSDTKQQKLEIESITSILPEKQKIDSVLKETKPSVYESKAVTKSFDVFGTNARIYYYPDKLPRLNQVNQQSIIEFFRNLSDNCSVWNYNINALSKIKQSCHFNDWGYYNILAKAAENIFDQMNEQVLFIWYALVESGYRVKVGYDNSNLYLLLSSQQELYNIQFLSENGLKYYLFPSEQNQAAQIKTYQGFYSNEAKIFSFRLNTLPDLNVGNIEYRKLMYNQKIVELEFNSSRMEFLNSFPQCELNVYFETPVSSINFSALDRNFIPLLKGKTNREKVDFLLDFIQRSVTYKTDQEQFGRERYMFAEECLYYPYSDCEDRSVLLGQLVKHYTGLAAIGLDFKTHVTLAVHFPSEEYGDYVLYNGKKYFICDSTYINATSGMVPENLKNEKPKVIAF